MIDVPVDTSFVDATSACIRRVREEFRTLSPQARERKVDQAFTGLVYEWLHAWSGVCPSREIVSSYKERIGRILAYRRKGNRSRRPSPKHMAKKNFDHESPEEYAERMAIYDQVAEERAYNGQRGYRDAYHQEKRNLIATT